ncbi:MAG: hypothetical protein D6681_16400 [Calditrichaeota bacterium]|nr:MAG: hypothetical protein D6681_16400 [Calditrichota bacterium]
MSQSNGIPLEEWKALYDAAVAFRDLACWEWMYDSDIFGVQNPENDEIGYCCIMGQLGEHYAMALYLGTEGLVGYLELMELVSEYGPMPEMILTQKCLMVTFGSRDEVTQEDRAIIKQLGLKFRGKNAWPVFRNYEPGYFPWYFAAPHVRFMTVALEQAMDVAQRFRENPDLLEAPSEGHYLVRVPEKKKGRLEWKDAYLAPRFPESAPLSFPPVDHLRIQRIRQVVQQLEQAWEYDAFHLLEPVRDEKNERPFFPIMLMCVDNQSGYIFSGDMLHPADFKDGLVEHFLNMVERLQFIPQVLLVRNELIFQCLKPVCQGLGIQMELVEALEMLDEARDGMMDFLSGGDT